MTERWSQRRAYAAWVIAGITAWCALIIGALRSWGAQR